MEYDCPGECSPLLCFRRWLTHRLLKCQSPSTTEQSYYYYCSCCCYHYYYYYYYHYYYYYYWFIKYYPIAYSIDCGCGSAYKFVTLDADPHHKSQRPETCIVRYHGNFCTHHAFEIELHWIAATGSIVNNMVGWKTSKFYSNHSNKRFFQPFLWGELIGAGKLSGSQGERLI